MSALVEALGQAVQALLVALLDLLYAVAPFVGSALIDLRDALGHAVQALGSALFALPGFLSPLLSVHLSALLDTLSPALSDSLLPFLDTLSRALTGAFLSVGFYWFAIVLACCLVPCIMRNTGRVVRGVGTIQSIIVWPFQKCGALPLLGLLTLLAALVGLIWGHWSPAQEPFEHNE